MMEDLWNQGSEYVKDWTWWNWLLAYMVVKFVWSLLQGKKSWSDIGGFLIDMMFLNFLFGGSSDDDDDGDDDDGDFDEGESGGGGSSGNY